MPEIKSNYTREDIDSYARANQLDVLNPIQIAAKFLEIEAKLNNFK